MKIYSKLYMMLAVIAAVGCLSCSSNNSTNPINNNTTDTAYANITWTANTVLFTQDDISLNDSTYDNITFNSNNTKADSLKAGNIIFVYGKALRKVSTVSNDGSNISVTTEDCTLNEAISDGDIVWSKSMLFTPDLLQGVEIHSKYPTTQKVTGNDVSFSFPIGNGMTGKIKLTLNGERLDANCSITKSVGPANIVYSMEGYVQKMKQQGNIKYVGQKLKEFNSSTKNIEGEVTVSLVATGSSKDLMSNGFELPFVLLKYPVLVGGIPMFFNVKVLFVINTELASLDASAYLKTKFTFNSETGINYNGTDFGIIGSAGPYNMDFVKDSNWVASSTAAGINFGLTFPRFELQIFGNTIIPYAQTAFLLGGTFTFGVKTCLTIDCEFIGAVGYNFDFFGLLKTSGKKNIFDKKQNIKKVGDCP